MRRIGTGRFVGLAVGSIVLTACSGPSAVSPRQPVTVEVPVTATVTVTATPPLTASSMGWTSLVFDRAKLEDGVQTILTDAPPAGYGLDGVDDLACPAGQKVVAGNTFSCSLTLDGEARTVPVTVLDDTGRYEVSPPR